MTTASAFAHYSSAGPGLVAGDTNRGHNGYLFNERMSIYEILRVSLTDDVDALPVTPCHCHCRVHQLSSTASICT